jgi:serine protease Do
MSYRSKETGRSVSIILPLLFALLVASCSTPATPITPEVAAPSVDVAPAQASSGPTQVPVAVASGDGVLADLQASLETIYNAVSPSVVNIRVVVTVQSSQFPGLPFVSPQGPQQQEALGSGFVWDTQGHLVTNNHVVDGADQITVTFEDQTSVPAQVVGADPDSDLAVLSVDVPTSELHPVQESATYAKVGQIAIAIGNPFGLQGSMSLGIVSAVGRTLPVDTTGSTTGPSYTIPAVIQTDAPINPGNSGGVLVDDQGKLIGVTAAIVSASGSSSGVGFAIPAEIVQMVVPALIQNGHYDHPYIGVSGTTLTPSLASAMNLAEQQHGALLIDITPGGPADNAGLHGSDKAVDIGGQSVRVGGDVVIAIGGQTVNSFDDLAAYVALNTKVGQTVSMQVIRDGKEQSVDITIGARPTGQTASTSPVASQGAFLGIVGMGLTPDIAAAMNLPQDQTGVLIEQIQHGGPADLAGLQGSAKPVVINGQTILIGGDVITAIDNQPVADMSSLQGLLGNYSPNQQATLTVLRGGSSREIQVVLG